MARRTFPKEAGERVTLQARTTTRTRDRLQAAANESGRSLSQEMEMRLEQSLFIEDAAEKVAKETLDTVLRQNYDAMYGVLGGIETFSLLQDIAYLVDGVERDHDKRWFQSAEIRAQLYKVLESALPELLRSPRTGDIPSAFMRSIDYAKYLPERPRKPVPEMPKGMRFMTDEELQRFFYLNDDNADPPGSEAARQRQQSVVIPIQPPPPPAPAAPAAPRPPAPPKPSQAQTRSAPSSRPQNSAKKKRRGRSSHPQKK